MPSKPEKKSAKYIEEIELCGGQFDGLIMTHNVNVPVLSLAVQQGYLVYHITNPLRIHDARRVYSCVG